MTYLVECFFRIQESNVSCLFLTGVDFNNKFQCAGGHDTGVVFLEPKLQFIWYSVSLKGFFQLRFEGQFQEFGERGSEGNPTVVSGILGIFSFTLVKGEDQSFFKMLSCVRSGEIIVKDEEYEACGGFAHVNEVFWADVVRATAFPFFSLVIASFRSWEVMRSALLGGEEIDISKVFEIEIMSSFPP